MLRLLLAAGVFCVAVTAQDSTDSILSGLDDLLNKDDLDEGNSNNHHKPVNRPYQAAPGGTYQQHPNSGQYVPDNQQGYIPQKGNNRYPQNGPRYIGPTHRSDGHKPSRIHDARDIITDDDLLSPIGGIDRSIDNAGNKRPQHQVPAQYGQQGPGRQDSNRRVQPFHSRYTPNEPIPDKASYVRQSPNSVPRYQAVPNQPQHHPIPLNSYGRQSHQPSPRSGQQYNGNTPSRGPVYISDQKPRYGNNVRSHPNPQTSQTVPAFGVPPTHPQQYVSPHQNQHPNNNRNVPYGVPYQQDQTQQPYSDASRNNQQQPYRGAGHQDQHNPANNQQLPNYHEGNHEQTKPNYQLNSNPKRGYPVRQQTPGYRPDVGSQGQNGINQYQNQGRNPQHNQYNQQPQVHNLPHQNQPNRYNQPVHQQQPTTQNQANQYDRPNQPIQTGYPQPSAKSNQSPVQYRGSNGHRLDQTPHQTTYGQANPVQQHPTNQYQPQHQPSVNTHENPQQPSDNVYSPASQISEYPAKPEAQPQPDYIYSPAKPSQNEKDQYNQPNPNDGYSKPKISQSQKNGADPYQAQPNSGSQSKYSGENEGDQYQGNNGHNDGTPKNQPTVHRPSYSSSGSVYTPSEHKDTAPSYDQSEHGEGYPDNKPTDKPTADKTGGTYVDDIYPRAYPEDIKHPGGSSSESDPVHHLNSGHSDGNHAISHPGNSDYQDLYPAKEKHDEPVPASYPPVDPSETYPPGNAGTKASDIAKPSHVQVATHTDGKHDYSAIYPDTTEHKEPSSGTHHGLESHSDVEDDLYPTSTDHHIDHADPYTSKVSEATHDPYPKSSVSNDKDAIAYLESETPKTSDHLASHVHEGHSDQQYPEIYPDTHSRDSNTDSYPPKTEDTETHTEAYTSPQDTGVDTHPKTEDRNAKESSYPNQHSDDDIYSKSKGSDDDIYPHTKDTKSADGVYPKPIDSAFQPVHQTPAVRTPPDHNNHHKTHSKFPTNRYPEAPHSKFPTNRYPEASHSKFPTNRYPEAPHSKFPTNRYPEAPHSKFQQNQHQQAVKPKQVVIVKKPDPVPLPKPTPQVIHVLPQAIKNEARKPVETIPDSNPTPTFIPPGLQGHCYKYKDLSTAYKLSDHSFGYPEEDITEELRREPFLAPVLGFKNFAQTRNQFDTFGLGSNSQAKSNNDHLIARNIYPTGYKEGDFEAPVPRDVSCRTSTHSLRMFKLDGGHCWTVNPDHNKVTFKQCSAPGDYCNNCGVGRSGGGGSRGRCSEEYGWVEVWSYCEKAPPGQRIRPRRLYLPTGCSCKTYYC